MIKNDDMNQNQEIRQLCVEICHRLYGRGYAIATDGNISVRLGNGNFLVTRTGLNKGMISEHDLIEIDEHGNPTSPNVKPSTEIGMHLYIYSQRPDIHAVVHAHPPYATGFATARQPLDVCLFPEVIVGLGAIPLAEYATPSTDEVARSLEPYVKTADGILLANHGVVTYGNDLWNAFYKMEKVEHAAHIIFIARMLGGEKPLSREDVAKLREISPQSYGKNISGIIACDTDHTNKEYSVPSASDGDILGVVRRMLNGND